MLWTTSLGSIYLNQTHRTDFQWCLSDSVWLQSSLAGWFLGPGNSRWLQHYPSFLAVLSALADGEVLPVASQHCWAWQSFTLSEGRDGPFPPACLKHEAHSVWEWPGEEPSYGGIASAQHTSFPWGRQQVPLPVEFSWQILRGGWFLFFVTLGLRVILISVYILYIYV